MAINLKGCGLRHARRKVLAAIEQFGRNLSPELQRFLRPQEILLERLNHDECSHQERLVIGQKLAEFVDTRPGVGVKDGLPDIIWIEIPGGQVKLKALEHMFEVKPFKIAQIPCDECTVRSVSHGRGPLSK